MEYHIHISTTSGKGVTSALSAAVIVAKALQLENLIVDCGDKLLISVSKNSKTTDLWEIYRLTKENRELQKKKKP